MEELLIINPRKRGSKRRTVKRNDAGRFVKSSGPAPKRRKRNPVAAANPAPRYHARIRKAKRARRRNPAARIAGTGNFTSMLMAGLQGGLGAVAVDTVVGYLPLPDAVKTGYGKHVVRVAAAVALGTFGRRFLGPMARTMSAGALAVTMRDAFRERALNGPVIRPAMGDFSEKAGACFT